MLPRMSPVGAAAKPHPVFSEHYLSLSFRCRGIRKIRRRRGDHGPVLAVDAWLGYERCAGERKGTKRPK